MMMMLLAILCGFFPQLSRDIKSQESDAERKVAFAMCPGDVKTRREGKTLPRRDQGDGVTLEKTEGETLGFSEVSWVFKAFPIGGLSTN